MDSFDKALTSEPPFIVGIGASAGGLRAIEEFFDVMPSDSGAAFVLVQHLSPDYKSLMNELLERRTEMQVQRVTDGVALKPNTVFLIPPGQNLFLEGNQLRLVRQDRNQGYQPHFPIDLFFQAIATEQGTHTIGIILSGTGSDGSRGIQEISEAGGLVMAQDPKTAEFDGMPLSAIATGIVDLALPPGELAQTTYQLLTNPLQRQQLRDDQENQLKPSQIQTIVSIIKDYTDIDFTQYKLSSISRRIHRRCLITGYTNLDTYIRQLKTSEAEREALRNDLLITVTRFFRDTPAWETLENTIIPELISTLESQTVDSESRSQIRIWIAACATGEEAYSMAILLRELLDRANSSIEAKIFATDIDTVALEKASAGIYPSSISNDLSPERLDRFFVQKDDCYEIHRSIREMIIFANHNLAKDAGFTNMDLVTCRNVLIYMQPDLQQRVLRSLHFALKVNGILFLGESETLGDVTEEFTCLQRKWKIYQKLRNVRLPIPLNDLTHLQIKRPSPVPLLRNPQTRFDPLITTAFQSLLNYQQATCLIVNRQNQLIHVCGDALNLLRVPTGRASQDVVQMIPENLQLPISTALYQARQKREYVQYRGCQIVSPSGENYTASIFAYLQAAQNTMGEFALLMIKREETPVLDSVPAQFEANTEAAQYVIQLECELQQTRENLQATIEELETTNEEQQSTNEELIASNEELQSTNEELHSVNEELYTVNAEYQVKIQELLELNNDLDNLLRNTNIGVIFLDKDGHIRKFTPAATIAFNLVKADIGRPLEHLSHNLENFDLVEALAPFKQDTQPQEIEVKLKRENTYLSMRILPYITENQHIDGLLLTFIDISRIKETQRQLEAAETQLLNINEQLEQQVQERTAELQTNQHFLESITQSSPNYIYIYDLAQRYNIYTNRNLNEVLGYSPEALQTIGGEINEHIFHPDEQTKIASYHQTILNSNPSKDQVFKIEYRLRNAEGNWRWWYSQEIIYSLSEQGMPALLLGVASDIHDRKTAEAQLQVSEQNYRNLYQKTPVMLHSVNPYDEIISVSDYWLQCLGYELDEVVGRCSTDFLTPASQQYAIETVLPCYFETGSCTNVPYQVVCKDGSVRDILLSATAERNDSEEFDRSLVVMVDVTDLNQAKADLTRYRDHLEEIISERTTELQETNQKLQTEVSERQQIEQQLEQRATELTISNTGLEQFAYVVSHDLQEPLRAMTAFSQLLEQRYSDQLDSAGKGYVNHIVEGGIRMKAMIDGILELSRIDNQEETQNTPVNLEQTLETVLENLKIICLETQAVITHEALPSLNMIENHGLQLLQNLIVNSIKFRGPEPPRIHITAKQQSKGWLFSIQDNGIGIPKDQQKRIFQLFQKLHSQKAYKGYGIGLAICKKIVAYYQGDIWIESSSGKGATFYFTLNVDTDKPVLG
ncbi:MAG: CheR family methyltransferase [Cyanobacteria bacterium P01_H01_bin.105]